jgi:hypothetical protein
MQLLDRMLICLLRLQAFPITLMPLFVLVSPATPQTPRRNLYLC